MTNTSEGQGEDKKAIGKIVLLQDGESNYVSKYQTELIIYLPKGQKIFEDRYRDLNGTTLRNELVTWKTFHGHYIRSGSDSSKKYVKVEVRPAGIAVYSTVKGKFVNVMLGQ